MGQTIGVSLMGLDTATAQARGEKLQEESRVHKIIIKSTREQAQGIVEDARIESEMIIERAKQDALAVAADLIKTESVFRKKSEDRLREMEGLGTKLTAKETRLKKLESDIIGREGIVASETRRLSNEEARLRKLSDTLKADKSALNDEIRLQAVESGKSIKLATELAGKAVSSAALEAKLSAEAERLGAIGANFIESKRLEAEARRQRDIESGLVDRSALLEQDKVLIAGTVARLNKIEADLLARETTLKRDTNVTIARTARMRGLLKNTIAFLGDRKDELEKW